MYIFVLYSLHYYEDKYFISLFAHFKHKAKIYSPNFTHLLKISINNHTLLYININTHKYICINNHPLLYIHKYTKLLP